MRSAALQGALFLALLACAACAADGTDGDALGGSGGSGATGGMAAVGGQSGSSGCSNSAQCPVPQNPCEQATCENQVCGSRPIAAGTHAATQTPGDCKRLECDGSGNVTSVNDDADVLDDSKECTADVCSNGTPQHDAKLSGTTCSAGVCDASGSCVQCLAPNDCPGADDECKQRSCSSGICGSSFSAAGTVLSAQTMGDCKKQQCDGSGNIETITDNADLPDDSNTCTDDVCSAGVPSNPPKSTGTACSAGVCDNTGKCVGCNTPDDCPGTDTECKARTCNNKICGVGFTAANTPVSAQTAGDCKQDVCDGNGNVSSINLDTDPKVDGKQCTQDLCVGGTPSNPAENQTKACTESGGKLCDGAGSCVECNSSTTCGGGTCADNQCAPAVISTTPAEGSVGVAVTAVISLTFSEAMAPATLTAQTSNGACSGSIQVSFDDFASCIGMGQSGRDDVCGQHGRNADSSRVPGIRAALQDPRHHRGHRREQRAPGGAVQLRHRIHHTLPRCLLGLGGGQPGLRRGRQRQCAL